MSNPTIHRTGIFGLTDAEVLERGHITLNANAARDALGALTPADIKEHDHDVRILYDGHWRRLYREDLSGQVATHRFSTVADYRAAVVYGARITDNDFVVIDSLTEG